MRQVPIVSVQRNDKVKLKGMKVKPKGMKRENETFKHPRNKLMRTAVIKKKMRLEQQRYRKTQRKVKIKLITRMCRRDRQVESLKTLLWVRFYKSVSQPWFLRTMMAFCDSGIYR